MAERERDGPVETQRDPKHCLVLSDVPESRTRRRARRVPGVRRHGVWDRNPPWGRERLCMDYVISIWPFAIRQCLAFEKVRVHGHSGKPIVSHPCLTETSRRGTTRQREKIKHKVSEHHKKAKKQARKDKAAGKRAWHLVVLDVLADYRSQSYKRNRKRIREFRTIFRTKTRSLQRSRNNDAKYAHVRSALPAAC